MRIENALKYSNGGCSGFKPDSFYIYSVNNFSNRILIIGSDYITNRFPCQAKSIPIIRPSSYSINSHFTLEKTKKM